MRTITLRASGTLKALSRKGSRALQLDVCGGAEILFAGRFAPQGLLRFRGAPGLVGHPAERDANVAHHAVLDLERRRDRDQGEGVRGPLANLAVL